MARIVLPLWVTQYMSESHWAPDLSLHMLPHCSDNFFKSCGGSKDEDPDTPTSGLFNNPIVKSLSYPIDASLGNRTELRMSLPDITRTQGTRLSKDLRHKYQVQWL